MALSDSEREAYLKEREKFKGVLGRFAQAKMEDDRKANEGGSTYSQDSMLTAEEQQRYKSLYERKLNEMRQDPTNDAKIHAFGEMVAKQKQMVVLSDQQLNQQGCLKVDNDIKVKVIHAYCPNCGSELTADGPKMYNPFTMESIAKHDCKQCGKTYNLENAYPRIAIIDMNGMEVKAYGF